jgi:TRAP-type transport system periplasmic protein
VRYMLALGVLIVMQGDSAFADPQYVMRLATAAPEGTAWARAMAEFGREVESATNGGIRVKWYFGGVAGDEVESGERLRRGQLDGIASGSMLCERVAPSMRILRVLGLFQNADEVTYVTNRLRPAIEEEAQRNGMTVLNFASAGPDVLFSRTPIRTFDDFRKARLWRWDLDDVGIAMSREMGLQVIPTPLNEAGKAYDAGRLDGFVAVPVAAVGFQWSVRAHYYVSDLRLGYLMGCLLVANRAFDRLPAEYQQHVRAAGAQLGMRMYEVGRQQDEALLGDGFKRQGLTAVSVGQAFYSRFFAEAQAAGERLGDKLVPKALFEKVLRMVADYRAEHVSGNAANASRAGHP